MLENLAHVERNPTLEQLKVFISDGGYLPGDRLPAERDLINSLGVSRSMLRKGLEALEREGVIWRHVGKGTFVAARNNESCAELHTLSQQVTPVQMMRARLALEPAIAKEAAINASGEMLLRIRSACQSAVDAQSWDLYENADDAFHRTIAESTGNVLLCSLFDHLNQVRRAVSWRQVVRKTDKPPENHASFNEHESLVSAIAARDPVAAQTAMRMHLQSVSERLYGE